MNDQQLNAITVKALGLKEGWFLGAEWYYLYGKKNEKIFSCPRSFWQPTENAEQAMMCLEWLGKNDGHFRLHKNNFSEWTTNSHEVDTTTGKSLQLVLCEAVAKVMEWQNEQLPNP